MEPTTEVNAIDLKQLDSRATMTHFITHTTQTLPLSETDNKLPSFKTRNRCLTTKETIFCHRLP